MLKKTLIAFVVLAFALPVIVVGPFFLRVEAFDADLAAGYHAPFYLYVPSDVAGADGTVTLLVQPNNSGTNSDDASVHRDDAFWTTFGRKGIADELGVALLVPAFVRPARDWHVYTHALDRDTFTTERADLARLDLQLLAMIDVARATLAERGLDVDERVLVQGYSASAMFANRFATLHPTRVKAVAAGSPGGWPIAPVAEHAGERLVYPVGVADLEALTGEPFDRIAYRDVAQLHVLGALDDNDSVDFIDGWDEEHADVVDRLFGDTPRARWDHVRALHERARADATFLLVDGVGHDRHALQEHSTRFFARILADEKP